MTHFHAKGQHDNDTPTVLDTDRHLGCIAFGMMDELPVFAVNGWRMDLFQGSNTGCIAELIRGAHRIRITIEECSCPDGEAEVREQSNRIAAPFN